MAGKQNVQPTTLTALLGLIESTCLPLLIQLYEGFKHQSSGLGFNPEVSLLKTLALVDSSKKFEPARSSESPLCLSISTVENVNEEDEVGVDTRAVQSFLEEVGSIPDDVVGIVKQEVVSESVVESECLVGPDIMRKELIASNAKEIEKIEETQQSGPKYHCQECYKPFYKLQTLELHRQKKHKARIESKHQCNICSHGFSVFTSLITHIRRKHPDKRKNICGFCGEYFEDPAKCRQHVKEHQTDRLKRGHKAKAVQRRTRSERRALKCGLCGSKFSLKTLLQKHIVQEHKEEMERLCQQCGKYFDDTSACQSHMQQHVTNYAMGRRGIKRDKKQVRYTCGKCKVVFGRRDTLQSHIIEEHSTVKDCMCGQCGNLFDTPENCREHIHIHFGERIETTSAEVSHENAATMKSAVGEIEQPSLIEEEVKEEPATDPNAELHCHLCGRRFYTLCSLQRHILRNHHDEKDQLCRYCGRFFKDAEECSKHVHGHIVQNRKRRQVLKEPTGLVNGKYSCQLCGKTFRLIATLRCHRLRAHPLEKDRLCPRCGKYFETAEACTRHRRLHFEKHWHGKNKARAIANLLQGPKVIKCHLCNTTFYVRGGIGNHIQRKHPVERHRICKYCGKYFSTINECKTHVRLHVIERKELRNSHMEKLEIKISSQQNAANQEDSKERKDGHCEIQESLKKDTNSVTCEACGRGYKLLSSFRRHICQYHPQMQDRLCHHCGVLLEDVSACKEHIEKAHTPLHKQRKTESKLVFADEMKEEHDNEEETQKSSKSAFKGKMSSKLKNSAKLTSPPDGAIPAGYIKCGLCPSILGSRSSMRDHIKSIHSKLQDHMCTCCGKYFENASDCLEHQQLSRNFVSSPEADGSDIPPGYLKCGLCTSVLGSKKSMRDHIRSLHFKEKDHMCACCGKYFENTEDKDKHQKPKATNLSCELCSQMFKSQLALDKHMKRHSNQRDFQCDICGNCYFDKKGLNAHRERHTAQANNVFKCVKCDKVLSSQRNLDIHMRIHNNDRPYICEICGKGFTQVSTLRIHRNIHSEIKPYECEICGKKARTKGDLGRHMSLHSEKKEFVCDICGKSYRFVTGLNQHKSVHSGLRPHVCKECGCTYKTSNDLRKHMKTHMPGAKTKGTTVPKVPVSSSMSKSSKPSRSGHQRFPSVAAALQSRRPPPPPQVERPQQPSAVPPPTHPHDIPIPANHPLSNNPDLSAILPARLNSNNYTSEEMAVVMALQVLDDISVFEQPPFGGPASQGVSKCESNTANCQEGPEGRRYYGAQQSYQAPVSLRRFDSGAPNYP